MALSYCSHVTIPILLSTPPHIRYSQYSISNRIAYCFHCGSHCICFFDLTLVFIQHLPRTLASTRSNHIHNKSFRQFVVHAAIQDAGFHTNLLIWWFSSFSLLFLLFISIILRRIVRFENVLALNKFLKNIFQWAPMKNDRRQNICSLWKRLAKIRSEY